MNEEQKEYLKATGEQPIYNNIPTDAYKKWLERKEIEKGIKLVIEWENKEWEKLIIKDVEAKRKAKENERLRRREII